MSKKEPVVLKRGQVAVNKQDLYALLNVIISVTEKVDTIMKESESNARGKLVAQEMNRLDNVNDHFRHFQLGIPLDETKKLL